jgi:MYXO-CTERM domain-containing protein
MSFKRSIVSLGFLAIALAAPAARAQTCKVNADCSKGFFCELVSAPPTDPGPTEPPCPSGSICPVTDPAPTTKLVAPAPAPTGYCQEASCKADADCGTGMLCHTETFSACAGGTATACPNGADCLVAKPADPVCTETKVSTCMYKWQLPCNVDNDCGSEFSCKPTVSSWCSGSAGTAPSGSGTGSGTAPAGTTAPSTGGAAVAPIPPEMTCGTSTSFPGYCEPKVTTCVVDTDCPATWICAAAPPTRTTNGSGVAVGSPTSTGTGGSTGTADVATPPSGANLPAPVTTRSCVSPVIYVAQDVGGTTTTGSGNGGTTGTGPVPAKGGNPGATGTPMSPESAQPAAGCAVGGSSSGSPFALLLLGALGLLVTRRKR